MYSNNPMTLIFKDYINNEENRTFEFEILYSVYCFVTVCNFYRTPVSAQLLLYRALTDIVSGDYTVSSAVLLNFRASI